MNPSSSRTHGECPVAAPPGPRPPHSGGRGAWVVPGRTPLPHTARALSHPVLRAGPAPGPQGRLSARHLATVSLGSAPRHGISPHGISARHLSSRYLGAGISSRCHVMVVFVAFTVSFVTASRRGISARHLFTASRHFLSRHLFTVSLVVTVSLVTTARHFHLSSSWYLGTASRYGLPLHGISPRHLVTVSLFTVSLSHGISLSRYLSFMLSLFTLSLFTRSLFHAISLSRYLSSRHLPAASRVTRCLVTVDQRLTSF